MRIFKDRIVALRPETQDLMLIKGVVHEEARFTTSKMKKWTRDYPILTGYTEDIMKMDSEAAEKVAGKPWVMLVNTFGPDFFKALEDASVPIATPRTGNTDPFKPATMLWASITGDGENSDVKKLVIHVRDLDQVLRICKIIGAGYRQDELHSKAQEVKTELGVPIAKCGNKEDRLEQYTTAIRKAHVKALELIVSTPVLKDIGATSAPHDVQEGAIHGRELAEDLRALCKFPDNGPLDDTQLDAAFQKLKDDVNKSNRTSGPVGSDKGVELFKDPNFETGVRILTSALGMELDGVLLTAKKESEEQAKLGSGAFEEWEKTLVREQFPKWIAKDVAMCLCRLSVTLAGTWALGRHIPPVAPTESHSRLADLYFKFAKVCNERSKYD